MSLHLFNAGSIFTFFRQKISQKTPKKTFIPLKLNTLLLIFCVVQYAYKSFWRKPYGKSQFFKLFKRYDTGSYRFEFQYTETMKKVSVLISDYVCIPSRLGEGVKRAAKEKFHLWCKKMRLDPQKI